VATPTRILRGWGGTSAPGEEILGENLEEIARDAVLTRGLGRSYGDSSLPPPGAHKVAGSTRADQILLFDEADGLLRGEAGVSLAKIQRVILPRGWSFPVLPGTQYVTLGGMVAADVHGKNHHVDGTIGRHVQSLRLLLADGRVVRCSREERADLFRATLGGMGLTGHILEAEVRLQPIPSPWIWAETQRVESLEDLILGLRTAASDWPFTVGWLDALATGRGLGRGILIRGRWAEKNEAPTNPPAEKHRMSVPFYCPGWLLNRVSMRAFNTLYFRRHPRRLKAGIRHPESFFHPLDAVSRWNRIYGRRGFTQHQCVLPETERPGATRRFLESLVSSRAGSFLCVIKDCGEVGEGLLSFPRPGISIAVDLQIKRTTQEIVNQLNRRVIAEGGRIYLTKDSLTRRDHFAAMEPRLEAFDAARRRWDPERRLQSAQSVRLLEQAR